MNKFTRRTIEANEEIVIPHNSKVVNVLNMGPGNVYINVNGEATLDGLLFPPHSSRMLTFKTEVKAVHVIADDTALIQIDGLE